jgi:hypothetical protein
MAEKYIYHFNTQNPVWTDNLTCEELVHMLRKRPAQKAVPPAALEPHTILTTGSIPLFVPTEQTLAEEWKEIAKLQWVYASEAKMSTDEVVPRLSARVRLAIRRVQEHVCPPLNFQGITRNTLLQFIVMGRETLISAGSDGEFFRFAEKEMQHIDLSALLD